MPKRLSDDQQTIRIPPKLFGEVQVRADTFNEDDRTVEIVWAAGASVRRYSWDEGYYMEELSMDPKHIRMERFATGMSLLDSHDSWSMDSRLGTVVPGSVRVEGGKGTARVKLSRKQRAEELLQDLRDGHPFPVSVGYKIHAYERRDGDNNALPTLRAVDWEPMELSAVPVPADAGAHSRSAENADTSECIVIRHDAPAASSATQMEKPMNKREAAKKYSGDQLDALALGAGITRSANETDEALRARLLAAYDTEDAAAEQARRETEERTRREAEEADRRNAPPAPQQVDQDAIRRQAAETERARVSDIHAIAARHDVPAQVLKDAIDKGTSVDAFRAKVLDMLVEESDRTQINPLVDQHGRRQDEVDTRRAAVVNALMHRMNGSIELKPEAREWRGLSLLETGRELLRMNGVNVRGMSRMELATKLFERGAYNTTSDFPIILEQITNRTLRAAYDVYGQTFKAFCRKVTAVDFKDMHRVQVGEVGDLKKVNEHGEYESTTFGEGKEKYRIATYGRIIGITRQVIINDDLGVFTNMAQKFGNAVARLESKVVWGIIIDNQKMSSDGKAIFHADHANLTGTGTALSATSLNVGRAMMGKHKDIDNRDLLDIRPKFLLHAPEIAFTVAQLFGSFSPTKTSDIVPDYVRALTPIEENRLSSLNTGLTWHLVADPNQIDTIEYAYLEGNEGPYTETEQGFDIDGMRVKVRQDFGAAPIDWRGFYRNNGAA
jgi:hypothetical protein